MISHHLSSRLCARRQLDHTASWLWFLSGRHGKWRAYDDGSEAGQQPSASRAEARRSGRGRPHGGTLLTLYGPKLYRHKHDSRHDRLFDLLAWGKGRSRLKSLCASRLRLVRW